jgi:hypothetical protein
VSGATSKEQAAAFADALVSLDSIAPDGSECGMPASPAALTALTQALGLGQVPSSYHLHLAMLGKATDAQRDRVRALAEFLARVADRLHDISGVPEGKKTA